MFDLAVILEGEILCQSFLEAERLAFFVHRRRHCDRVNRSWPEIDVSLWKQGNTFGRCYASVDTVW